MNGNNLLPLANLDFGFGQQQQPVAQGILDLDKKFGINQPPVSAWGNFKNGLEGFGGLFGEMTPDGWKPSGLSHGLNLGAQAFSAWGGMKQLDLAKKQFNLQKDLMNKNYAAQRGLTNTRLRDRQNARNAADSNAYQDTSSYMKENEVK